MLRVCIFLMLLLSACGPIYETRYDYVPPRDFTGRECVNSCMGSKNKCKNVCQANQYACQGIAEIKAKKEYKEYVKECERKRVTKAPFYEIDCVLHKKTFANFRNDKQCNVNCDEDCKPDYNSCYTNCGGSINSHQVCIAFCNKG